tara:strand:- start:214 stop:345 length:132 start_codon:yes stop_codon:yes gene_type:complete
MKKDDNTEKFLKHLLGSRNEHSPRARRRKMERALKKFKKKNDD